MQHAGVAFTVQGERMLECALFVVVLSLERHNYHLRENKLELSALKFPCKTSPWQLITQGRVTAKPQQKKAALLSVAWNPRKTRVTSLTPFCTSTQNKRFSQFYIEFLVFYFVKHFKLH